MFGKTETKAGDWRLRWTQATVCWILHFDKANIDRTHKSI